ncbi:MAG: class I SAM-dependent methyltransferase, partial [Planctomycetota bacterium]
MQKSSYPGASRRRRQRRRPRRLQRLIENDLISKVTFDEYRSRVQRVYGGPKGAFLTACSTLSLHIPLGKRLFRSRKFDLAGARRVLDVGSGAGQLAGHVLRYADPDASVACTDLSHRMLRRARNRLADRERHASARFIAADLS